MAYKIAQLDYLRENIGKHINVIKQPVIYISTFSNAAYEYEPHGDYKKHECTTYKSDTLTGLVETIDKLEGDRFYILECIEKGDSSENSFIIRGILPNEIGGAIMKQADNNILVDADPDGVTFGEVERFMLLGTSKLDGRDIYTSNLRKGYFYFEGNENYEEIISLTDCERDEVVNILQDGKSDLPLPVGITVPLEHVEFVKSLKTTTALHQISYLNIDLEGKIIKGSKFGVIYKHPVNGSYFLTDYGLLLINLQ